MKSTLSVEPGKHMGRPPKVPPSELESIVNALGAMDRYSEGYRRLRRHFAEVHSCTERAIQLMVERFNNARALEVFEKENPLVDARGLRTSTNVPKGSASG